MQVDNRTIVYVITGRTQESARAAEAAAKLEIAPEAVSIFVSRAFPGGIEKRFEERFRIGDYFDFIEVSDVSGDPLSYRIAFHVREGVDSWWKALIDRVLSRVRSTAGVSIKFMTPG